MKKTFDILPISPTQWVLVDKTRKPRKEENCISLEDDELYMEMFIYDGRFDDMTEEEIDEEGLLNETFPILAAYPKIEGVLLLPSLLWEKPTMEGIFESKYGFSVLSNRDSMYESGSQSGFIQGYEAAGGYTIEQMWQAWNDGIQFAPSAHFSNEESRRRYFEETLLNRLSNHSPRALVIEVGEDGSIPSENDTIIYTEAIY